MLENTDCFEQSRTIVNIHYLFHMGTCVHNWNVEWRRIFFNISTGNDTLGGYVMANKCRTDPMSNKR